MIYETVFDILSLLHIQLIPHHLPNLQILKGPRVQRTYSHTFISRMTLLIFKNTLTTTKCTCLTWASLFNSNISNHIPVISTCISNRHLKLNMYKINWFHSKSPPLTDKIITYSFYFFQLMASLLIKILAKNLTSYLWLFFFSHPHIQTISRSYQIYPQKIPRIKPILTTSTTITLV